MTRTKYLYHVSPITNHASILKLGLEPSLFSRDRHKKLWLAEWEKLPWALAHCARRFNLKIDELEIWMIPPNTIRRLQKTAWRGVLQTPCAVKTKLFMTSANALNRYEHFLQDVTYAPGEKIR